MTNANETSASLFAWMPFYSELATKLLAFKNNRKTLLSRLQAVFDDHPNLDFPAFDGIPDDIDPFTVFAFVNRGLSRENATLTCAGFKRAFGLASEVPELFPGLPRMDNRNVYFFRSREHRGDDVDKLWQAFEAALTHRLRRKILDILLDKNGWSRDRLYPCLAHSNKARDHTGVRGPCHSVCGLGNQPP